MPRRICLHLFVALLLAANAGAQPIPDTLVFIEGGAFRHPKSNFHGKGAMVASFYMGRYEVTQREWMDVMESNPSEFKGDDLPVEMVSWYDCIEYCNRRSVKEGLTPYYTIDKSAKDPGNEHPYDELKWTVTANPGANGYRLPTEAEWEYAAIGGRKSTGYLYSGADDLNKVAWYWQNSGEKPLEGVWNWPMLERNRNRTQAVGGKAPNELGLFDLSGNVREWCWDWFADEVAPGADPTGPGRGAVRVWKGGGWMGGDFCCEPWFRANFEPYSRGYDHGFRVCRDK